MEVMGTCEDKRIKERVDLAIEAEVRTAPGSVYRRQPHVSDQQNLPVFDLQNSCMTLLRHLLNFDFIPDRTTLV